MAEYLILKKRKDFLKAAKNVTFVTPHVIVQAAFCSDEDKTDAPRVGFTATKKIGKAHYRNLSKRRLRAVVREIKQQYLANHTDSVLVARRDTGTCLYADLKSSSIFALKKANSILIKNQKENEKTSDCVN